MQKKDFIEINFTGRIKGGEIFDSTRREDLEKSGIQGTKKEILDRVKQRIDSYFLPHIGLEKGSRTEKAATLSRILGMYLKAKENDKIRTDKDHYANKRVRMSGDLLADLFRINMNILLRDIQHSLQKIQKRKKSDSDNC